MATSYRFFYYICITMNKEKGGVVHLHWEDKKRIVLKEICDHYGVQEAELYKRGRQAPDIMGKHCLRYNYVRDSHMSLKEVGREVSHEGGAYDHSSIINSCEVWQDMIDTGGDNGLQEKIDKAIGRAKFETLDDILKPNPDYTTTFAMGFKHFDTAEELIAHLNDYHGMKIRILTKAR